MVPKVFPELSWQDGRALTRRPPAYVTLGAGLMAEGRCHSSIQRIPSLGEGRQEGDSPAKEGEVPRLVDGFPQSIFKDLPDFSFLPSGSNVSL